MTSLEEIRQLDAADPLASFRDRFLIPKRPDGSAIVYLCGHSLGLQPTTTRGLVERELDRWATLGVEGHFHGVDSWYQYHELLTGPLARLVGAQPGEVVAMNGLTVNLHLMLATFYRPTRERHAILIDAPTFPSDRYAVGSQLRLHGFDPAAGLIAVEPRAGEATLRHEDLEAVLERRGGEIAVVLLSGVNFFTGQVHDIARLTALAHRQGCIVGLDLAHAVGNLPLELHAWNVDFAVWCSYKYLNSGPGAVAGCFVHHRHGQQTGLPRLAGWWGNDPATRFRMHLEPDFIARAGADGWQLSNPPILALAPVRASLDLFDEAGMAALRAKSVQLTGLLESLISGLPPGRCTLLTPSDPSQRGCQLSLIVHDRPRELMRRFQAAGIVCDFREPDVIRAAPVPLYNTFEDVWNFARVVAEHLA